MPELQIIEKTPAAINEFRDDAKATIGRNGDLIDTYLKDKYGDKIPNNIREAAYKKGVTINGKKVNLRSGLPTKYRIGNATHKIGKVTDWYRNELIAKATNKPNPSNITLPGIGPKTSGMFSTPGERKTTRSTGVYRGQFIVGKVLRQADQNATIDELKTLRRMGLISVKEFDSGMENVFQQANRGYGRKNVPTEKLTYNPKNWEKYGTPRVGGKLATVNNFLKAVNDKWDDLGIAAQVIEAKEGVKIDRGHIISSEDWGPNYSGELQPRLAIVPKGKIGVGDLTANISQGADTLRDFDDLLAAGVARNVTEAYNDYAISGSTNITRFDDLPLKNRVLAAHGADSNITALGQEIEGTAAKLDKAGMTQIEAANVDPNIGRTGGKVDTQIVEVKSPKGKLKWYHAAGGLTTAALWAEAFRPGSATSLDINRKLFKGDTETPWSDIGVSYGKDLATLGGTFCVMKATQYTAAKYLPKTLLKKFGPAALPGPGWVYVALGLADTADDIFTGGAVKSKIKQGLDQIAEDRTSGNFGTSYLGQYSPY